MIAVHGIWSVGGLNHVMINNDSGPWYLVRERAEPCDVMINNDGESWYLVSERAEPCDD